MAVDPTKLTESAQIALSVLTAARKEDFDSVIAILEELDGKNWMALVSTLAGWLTSTTRWLLATNILDIADEDEYWRSLAHHVATGAYAE